MTSSNLKVTSRMTKMYSLFQDWNQDNNALRHYANYIINSAFGIFGKHSIVLINLSRNYIKRRLKMAIIETNALTAKR